MTDPTKTKGKEKGDTLEPPAHFDGRLFGHIPVMIHAQYIKDLSLENPNAPETYRRAQDGAPVMDVNFTMDARKLDNGETEGADLYEVSLGVTASAKRGDMTMFVVEVLYGLTCSLQKVPDERRHPFLLIEMPRYMFPFVRQIISQMTQSAGYAPLMLSPVDFKRLYMERFASDEVPATRDGEEAAGNA